MAKKNKAMEKSGTGGFVFVLTYIGAAVYFVQQSEGFWGFILALLQAAVWPAFLIHRVFELLQI
jgi:hypothetical protein